WWSDNWNPLDYGKDFDFNRGFFEQFGELMRDVPQIALLNSNRENTYYANFTYSNKNCYLCFAGMYDENCCYSKDIFNSNECVDCFYIHKSQYCYECIDCIECYEILFSKDCISCGNGYFLNDCENCKNCFGCVGLKNKDYHFFNVKYSPREYKERLKDIFKSKSIKEISLIFNDFILKFPIRINQNKNTINCYGDYILNSKDCYNCFEGENIENSKFIYNAYDSKNCYDTNNVDSNSELIYEGFSMAGFNLSFSMITWFCEKCYYSLNIHNSKNCFGCIGLRNKSYCILNKQYTKQQYEELVPKIIEYMMKPHPNPLLTGEGKNTEVSEWGEFFPSSISPFGYNETVAQEYFPISRDKALSCLYKWSDYEPPFPKVDKIIPANKLPENISDIPDDILNRAIECEITKKPFRIIKQELEFYRKHNLPIPKRHPDQRHLDRMSLRNPRKLFDRKCDKCGKEIKTTYSPDRKEIVYCEECYNKEIY
ncbi:MAG: hypothetical protein PHE25_06250, partial [Candidatus Gracilibacteria bacterium]|nr:hypothetical protein [Candidatus Gracilibacteria bacterium]